ncbi:hypothetical protein Tco_0511997 [Tanacetum coccineum]
MNTPSCSRAKHHVEDAHVSNMKMVGIPDDEEEDDDMNKNVNNKDIEDEDVEWWSMTMRKEKEREILNHDLENVERALGNVLERVSVLESGENAPLRKGC